MLWVWFALPMAVRRMPMFLRLTADVAAAVAFLLAVPSVTGAVVPVDGGQHLL